MLSVLAHASYKGKMSKKLYVGNIPTGCKTFEIQELFGRYGKVTECDVLADFGFVVSEAPKGLSKAR